MKFDMDVQFSGELRNLMNSTKNKFGFTFLEVTGKHRLAEIVTVWGTPTDGQAAISNLPEFGGIYHLQQELKLKDNITSDELNYVTSPTNYMFATINENKQVVAATMGLDAGTIQK
ncbi:hypothetical protein J7E79_00160 [Bacillus sp. ISL-40]|uniref:hypothetical protein n=1 Tax=unclassified Bacillus (in: firmicutes) TaxID=185979 RepID=UPI001BEB3CA4|nr:MULTISPECIES: hypothetical protein [unclassified Bacillus (in: firmicutes)]MBT2695861.1 hypothetical protein [Bacillus sp. ISL-40]MBT2743869.1 hypothetical protein [Bacillus sp. ISL-77]